MSGLKQFLKKSSLLVRLARWVKQTGPYAAWQYRRDEAAYQRVAPLWEKDRPGMLLLENTNFCNAKCTMCPNPNMRRKKVTMSDELFYKIVDDYDQIGGGVIQVNGTGEPLLDKGLEDKIRYARSKANIQEIVFFSNGALMTAERAASVLAACPHRVSFSIDGLDKESYERVRVGLSWEKVYPHIQGFLALWNEAGRPFEVRIQSMVEGSVAAAMQSEAYQKFVAAGASVNIGSLTDAHDWSGAVALDNSAHRARAGRGARRIPSGACRRPALRRWRGLSP